MLLLHMSERWPGVGPGTSGHASDIWHTCHIGGASGSTKGTWYVPLERVCVLGNVCMQSRHHPPKPICAQMHASQQATQGRARWGAKEALQTRTGALTKRSKHVLVRAQGLESLTMVSAGGHTNAMGRWCSAAVVPLDEEESMEFYLHNGACARIWSRVRACMVMCVRVWSRVCLCTYACMCACVRACVCVCVRVWSRVCVWSRACMH